jgi:hypothetical protein
VRVATCLGLLLVLAGCGPSQPVATPAPSALVKPVGSVAAIRPPGAPRVLVTVSGAMDAQTEPFRLDGGRYIAAWSVEPEPATRSCIGNLTLKSPDDPRFQQSIVSGLEATIIANGTTQLYTVPAGSYYVAADSNCPIWKVTFTPS